jgi:hypothetical protein
MWGVVEDAMNRFFIEVPPLTGRGDVMDVQFIGRVLGDGDYVVEAETEKEATEKLLDLLATRVGEGQVRLASGDEAEAFEERQYEGYETKETVARMRKMYGKGGLGNEQTS